MFQLLMVGFDAEWPNYLLVSAIGGIEVLKLRLFLKLVLLLG